MKQVELLNFYIWSFPVWYYIGIQHICAPDFLSDNTDDYCAQFQLCKKYEKSHDKSHQKCISVFFHFYKKYKFKENYVFDI